MIWRKKLSLALDRFRMLNPFYGSSQWKTEVYSTVFVTSNGRVGAEFCNASTPNVVEGRLTINTGWDSGTPSTSCTCKVFASHNICGHPIDFTQQLLKQLSQPGSEFYRRIAESDFDDANLDEARFKLDRTDQTLALLKGFFANTSVEQADELPDVALATDSRLAWEFSLTSGQLGVHLLQQRPKKRGGGWLKGRKISLNDLLDDDRLVACEQDRKARQVIKRTRTSSYYAPTISVDFVELGEALVGHTGVLLNGEPATPSIGNFEMKFYEEGERLVLRPVPPFAMTDRMHEAVTASGMLYIDLVQNRLAAVRCTPEQVRMLREIHKTPLSISKDSLPKRIDELRSLAEKFPLLLPTNIAGTVREDFGKPVALLRSRSTGELGVGLRIRDAQGRLFRPGSGPVIHHQVVDDAQVQWRRNLKIEADAMSDLAAKLGILDVLDDQFDGFISDFRQGLAFLATLESLDEPIELCWDRKTDRRPTVMGSVTSGNLKVQLESRRDWFGVGGQCDFKGTTVDLASILASMAASDNDASMDGDFIQVAPDQWARISGKLHQRLTRLANHTHSERGKLVIDRTGVHSVEGLVEDDVHVDAPKKWADTVAKMRKAETLQPVVPENLQAELRSYQQEGFAWMRRLAEWGVGGVLADDMGLGKTVQTLAVLLDRRNEGPALVIAPTSVGFNWARETERFAPDLKAHMYRDTDRGELLENIGPCDVVICSYGLALRDEATLAKVHWSTMVLDEAQAVKNSRSKTTRAVSVIPSDWKLALTGTPVENHLGELWSIFKVVSPGLLGSWEQFRTKFASPIERDNCPKKRAALSQVLQPFILRRTKSAVLTELPERTESNLFVDLSSEERSRYESWRLAAIGEIEGIDALTGTGDARFQVLAVLTRLRQLACNVGLVDKQWKGESSKLQLLLETMQELRAEGHRALIFSQFTEHLGKIRQAFDEHGFSYQYLDGSTPAKSRGELVDRFQNGEGDAFLISLKAGGTGLNLTAADYVIHMDPWWNPAVEDQATDRAHRIGQERPVMVYRIVARGTIEEEILRLHDTKRDLVAGILDGTSAAAKLSTEELVAMIRGGQ